MVSDARQRLRRIITARFEDQGLEVERKAEVYALFLTISVAIMTVASLVFVPLRPYAVLQGMVPVLLLGVLSLLVLLRGHLNVAVGVFTLVLTTLIFVRTVYWEHTPRIFLAESLGEFVFRLMFPLLAVTFVGTRRRLYLLVVFTGLGTLAAFYFMQGERLRMSGYSLVWAVGMYAVLVSLAWAVSGLNRGVIETLGQRSADLQRSHDALEQRNLDLREAQGELEQYRNHLEELVLQRTLALREAQDELVRKDRLATVGQLAATINHELRNPLGALSNAVVALRQRSVGDQDPKRARALDIAERNIARCARIVGEFLDFSRRPQPHPKATNIDGWIGQVLDELTLPDGVALRRDLGSGADLELDREWLRRAVVNLVHNGGQAAEDGSSAWVSVSTRLQEQRLVIEVSDSGPGIPDEDRERVFEPLYSTKTFGVGLGLPIVRQAMEELGGTVRMRGERAGATAFRLTLPLVPLEEEDSTIGSAPATPQGEQDEAKGE